mgnify:CR=1 FL=1
MTTERSKSRAGGVLAARLRAKGWTISSAALYLGVSRQRLYDVFSDPARARLWECAVAGIPERTPEINEALKTQRQRRPKAVPRAPIAVTEFELGDEVMTVKHAGIADEDVAGYIEGLRGEGEALEVLVVMPAGQDWFPRKVFHEYFHSTGINRNR